MKKITTLLTVLFSLQVFSQQTYKTVFLDKTQIHASGNKLIFITPLQTDHVFDNQIFGVRTHDEVLQRTIQSPDTTVPKELYLQAYKATGLSIEYKLLRDTFFYEKKWFGLIGMRDRTWKKILCTQNEGVFAMNIVNIASPDSGRSLNLGVFVFIIGIFTSLYCLILKDERKDYFVKINIICIAAIALSILLRFIYYSLDKDVVMFYPPYGLPIIYFLVLGIYFIFAVAYADGAVEEEDRWTFLASLCVVELVGLWGYTGEFHIAGKVFVLTLGVILFLLVVKLVKWLFQKLKLIFSKIIKWASKIKVPWA